MSCKDGINLNESIKVVGKEKGFGIKELIKANSIEEANKLLKNGHIFLSVYWNTAETHEEYILGKLDRKDEPERQVGFLRE